MKLAGYRVLDLSMFLPGPYLSAALADHGAEVIKVEVPGEGDPTRHIGLADGEHTVYFRVLNRGKKSIAVDLKDLEQRAAFLELCDSADVFIEAFRPGVAERLGVGQEVLRARNPRLVYCSISAFGNDSAYRTRPAHELAAEALSGALSLNLGDDGKPAIPGLPTGDLLSGLYALSGILMALLRRETTGKGDYLDISLLESLVGGLTLTLGPTLAEGRQPIVRHERTTGGAAFYRIYATSDGKHVALAGQEPKFIHALLGALGRPELAAACLRGPGAHQQPVMDFLEATFAQKTRAEWDAWLATLDVAYAPVKTLPEAMADPNLAARGMFWRDAGGRAHIGSPIRFRDEPGQVATSAPRLGEHNELLLKRG